MNLIFYGGGSEEDNYELDEATIKLTGKDFPKITYIPACSYGSESYFRSFVKHYQKFGIKQFIYFPIDLPFDRIIMSEALKSDIIHLSGGNTYYFLKHLRKTGLLKHLKEFVKRGGVLTGLSAGGILMTPTITTAGYPEFDKDENDEKLKNLRGLNLVKFEFFPHYRNSPRYDKDLIRESKKVEYPIYAIPDGSGVVVTDNKLKFIGKSYCFFKGKKVLLSNHLL